MLSFNTKKIVAAVLLSAVAALSVFVVSCQKELSGSGFNITETLPDLTTKISSSVSGFVTDENEAAVEGATIQAGGITTTTDKYGYFEINNAQVVKTAAVITAVKPGYFKGIKTYGAIANKSGFFRIKLIPKSVAGTIDAATGGTVTLTNGLSVTLPANGVVIAANSGAYTGAVSVAAHWINPTASDLYRVMPGDLRGLDSGYIKILNSYGMAAVELTGTSGELLQIKSGSKATLSFPLPAAIASSAPAAIPLWSFDETNGLWKKEGNANKSGNNYVGEVSHFSYWNCDVPLSNPVAFSCRVVDATNNPVPYAGVSISYANGNYYTGAHGSADDSGFVSGYAPANSQLILSVYGDACGGQPYTQAFTTTTTSLDLGTIVLPAASVANVTGNVNCNGTPVTNGYVIMKKDNTTYRYELSNTGTFSFNTPLCGTSSVVSFIGEDIATQQAGNLTTYTLVPGANAVGTLSGCGNSIDEFINYSINGTSYSITAPLDNVLMETSGPQSIPALIFVSGNTGNGTPNGSSAYFSFTETGIAAGSTQTLQSFSCRQINDSTGSVPASSVNITEYGAVGQFIAGNFTTTLTGAPPANTPYNITCTFRVRRN